MKLTQMQKTQGKWQRSFTRDKVSRCSWLTNNDKRFLNAIFDCRHMRHKSKCKPGCEPGWAIIPMKDLKKSACLGEAALKETIGRLVKKDVVKRKSEGLHAGRDGATRYRIISLPPYDPAPASHPEGNSKIESTAAPSVGPFSGNEPAHKQIVEAVAVKKLPHPSQPANPQSETE